MTDKTMIEPYDYICYFCVSTSGIRCDILQHCDRDVEDRVESKTTDKND